LKYAEVSVKIAQGVDDVFNTLARMAVEERRNQGWQSISEQRLLNLHKQKEDRSCCTLL